MHAFFPACFPVNYLGGQAHSKVWSRLASWYFSFFHFLPVFSCTDQKALESGIAGDASPGISRCCYRDHRNQTGLSWPWEQRVLTKKEQLCLEGRLWVGSVFPWLVFFWWTFGASSYLKLLMAGTCCRTSSIFKRSQRLCIRRLVTMLQKKQ